MEEIRERVLQARKTIPSRKTKEASLKKRLAPFLHGAVAAYFPIKGEADVYEPEFYLPKMGKGRSLKFGKGNLQTNGWGIPEPGSGWIAKEDIDVFLVPMVAFCGVNRMGYGKGYYDRYLKDAPGLKIGIAFDEQEAEFEANDWDVPMDLVITPTRTISVRYNDTDRK